MGFIPLSDAFVSGRHRGADCGLGTVANQATGGVAYAAHVGGFIFGAVTVRLFEDRERVSDSALVT